MLYQYAPVLQVYNHMTGMLGNISTTYLGRTESSRKYSLKAQEQFSITYQSTTVCNLLYGTSCRMLLESGATKSFMSKQYYFSNKSLHGLPKVISKAHVIHVGNEESVNILFIIHIIIIIQDHMFATYTMHSGTHDSTGLVLGVKNSLGLGGEINIRELNFKCPKRAVSIFPVHKEMTKPKERRYVKDEAPFLDEI